VGERIKDGREERLPATVPHKWCTHKVSTAEEVQELLGIQPARLPQIVQEDPKIGPVEYENQPYYNFPRLEAWQYRRGHIHARCVRC